MDNIVVYEFLNGEKVEVKDFSKPASDYYFKVNLPDTLDSYKSGNGEGVWAYTDFESYEKWKNDEKDSIIYVRILNDSIYYNGLEYGDLVPVELRGEYRPVAMYEELIGKYGPCNWK